MQQLVGGQSQREFIKKIAGDNFHRIGPLYRFGTATTLGVNVTLKIHPERPGISDA